MRSFIFVFTLVCSISLTAQTNYWKPIDNASQIKVAEKEKRNTPEKFQLFEANITEMNSFLQDLKTLDEGGIDNAKLIQLPHPSGKLESYFIYRTNVVADHVAHFYTNVITFAGYKKGSPGLSLRGSLGPLGFHLVVFDGADTYMVNPYLRSSDKYHFCHYKKNVASQLLCEFDELDIQNKKSTTTSSSEKLNTQLREFRLVLASAGEFSQEYGGTTAAVLATLATSTNIANGVFERDLAVKLILVSDASVVFLNASTDPYTGNVNSQNQTVCDNNIGSGNYDIGHVLFHGGGGGSAFYGVCNNNFKARANSGSNYSLTDFIIDYFCHEAGHQFGSPHNFNSQECSNSVSGYRYEPGEGSSIMCYAGVCGSGPSYQPHSDPFFHSISIDEMNDYIDSNANCYEGASPGNGNGGNPIVDAESNITIPQETPFVLVGSATDSNDGTATMTYFWEQHDGNGSTDTGTPNCNSTNQPLYRFSPAAADWNVKTFPDMTNILAGNNNGVDWEVLPCVTRTMNFKLIARDNNPNWGRVGKDAMVVTVANSGPFDVTTPNGGENYDGDSDYAVNWTVNNTDSHCSTVDILFSEDGGSTFSIVETAVTNDGSHTITMPNVTTSQGRIIVQCSVNGNFGSASTFFDVSDNNFNVTFVQLCELSVIQAIPTCQDNGTGADPSDDYYLVAVNASATENNGSTQFNVLNNGTLLVTLTYNVGGTVILPANDNDNITLDFVDVNDAMCSASQNIGVLSTCSDQCEITISALQYDCSDSGTPSDPTDDYYSITINATALNSNADNFYVFNNDGLLGTYAYGVGGTFNLLADGNPMTISLTDSADGTCQTSANLGDLTSCSDQCELTITGVQATCNDNGTSSDPNDDIYIFDINATAVNGSASNTYNVFNNGFPEGPFNYGNGGIFNTPATGNSPTLIFQDVDDSNCTATTVLDPLTSCSFQCELTITESSSSCNNNNTPFNISDDFYTVNVNASAINSGASNSFEVRYNSTVLGTYNYGVGGSFTMPASGDETNIVFADVDDPTCISVAALGFLTPCSEDCPTSLTENNNPITDDTYQAGETIFSSGTVPNLGDVIFKAGDVIHLEIGFEVESEGTFSAENEGCGEDEQ